jgi:hypothetical protein
MTVRLLMLYFYDSHAYIENGLRFLQETVFLGNIEYKRLETQMFIEPKKGA